MKFLCPARLNLRRRVGVLSMRVVRGGFASLGVLFLFSLFFVSLNGSVFHWIQKVGEQVAERRAERTGVSNSDSAGTDALRSWTRARSERDVSILFVGDVMLSRAIGNTMARANDWSFPFRNTAEVLQGADITFGNLENPISARGRKVGSAYSFRADPRAVEGLVFAGFDVVSVANNHAWDYGPDAFADTFTHLAKAGIAAVGGGTTYAGAHEPAIITANGVRIAFLAYTDLVPRSRTATTSSPAIAFLDPSDVSRDITAARRVADVVIVSFHWGEEYNTHRSERQVEIAHAAIDAGARGVIGHHPHVVQEVERYGGGVIAYSLGNFVFDQNFSTDTQKGLALRVTLRGKNILRVEELPVTFDQSFRPDIVSSEE